MLSWLTVLTRSRLDGLRITALPAVVTNLRSFLGSLDWKGVTELSEACRSSGRALTYREIHEGTNHFCV